MHSILLAQEEKEEEKEEEEENLIMIIGGILIFSWQRMGWRDFLRVTTPATRQKMKMDAVPIGS